MKKISNDKPVFGLSVKFKEGKDFTEDQGKIIQIGLRSRNTSVPMIVTANNSEAKLQGTDGIFALCSEKCGKKMKENIAKEIDVFMGVKDIALQ